MQTEERLDEILDQWEEAAVHDPRADVDAFLAEACRADEAPLVALARRRILALRSIDKIVLAPAGIIDPGASTDAPPLQIAAGSEPVPGYTLRRRIAAGGFGEVWEAAGPAGFPIAMKFVHLDAKGMVEMNALRIAKKARHPHLITTHGAWQRPGHLIIAMELADHSLYDRLQETLSEGQSGIPRRELLQYMQDAAAGIDYLNQPPDNAAGVQHRDVKPQNLLVVGGRVKVADFGIARVIHGAATGHTGRLSLAYAAPEFFSGQTSDRSDQYSLAVTYHHLLTGELPFAGTDLAVMRGHIDDKPDLSALPAADRPIIAQALSKSPADRFASCSEMVAALQCAASAGARVRPRRRRLAAMLAVTLLLAVVASGTALLTQYLWNGQAGEKPPSPGYSASGQTQLLPVSQGGNLLAVIAAAVAAGRVKDTGLLGNDSTYGTSFRDQCPHTGYLVGMRLTTGRFGRGFQYLAVGSIEPLYQTGNGVVGGKRQGHIRSNVTELRAKEGYAVGEIRGGIIGDGGGRLSGIQLVYMRVTSSGLDEGDGYESPVYLRLDTATIGDGRPIVGLFGRWAKEEFRSLGAIVAEVSPAP